MTGYTAYYTDILVGYIAGRVEHISSKSSNDRVVIMAHAVLEPYRHHKIGTTLVEYILGVVGSAGSIRKYANVSEVAIDLPENAKAAAPLYEALGFAAAADGPEGVLRLVYTVPADDK